MCSTVFVDLCRVCLSKSSKMFSLSDLFNNVTEMESTSIDQTTTIEEMLSKVLTDQECISENYPQYICSMCLEILSISYDFKILFEESQQVIFQFLGKQDLAKSNKIIPKVNISPQLMEHNTSNVSVELIAGPNKYNLKDLVIVEQEHSVDESNFGGFLKNLGKSISASFAGNLVNRKSNNSPVLEVISQKNNSYDNYHSSEIEEISDYSESESQIKSQELINADEYIIVEGEGIENMVIHTNENDTEIVESELANNSTCLNYECGNCKKVCYSKISYQNHINLCGSEVKGNVDDLIQSAVNLKYECNKCKRIYCLKTRYQKHIEKCGKQFKVVRDKQGDAKLISKYQCEYCSKYFKELKFLNYHVKSHKISFFSCDVCNQKFKTRSSRNYHRITRHNESKFVCQYCGKMFVTSTTLNVHVQTHDRTKAQCICSVCGKTFHYKGGLFYHMKQHNNDRKYKCEYCDKKFYTLTAKKRHILTHTGVRPYECKFCQKRFFSRGELTKHEYIHTGVLPYKCKYCDKGFTSRFNMKVHWCNHPGNFVCDFCNRGFISREVLVFHSRIKHKESLKQKE